MSDRVLRRWPPVRPRIHHRLRRPRRRRRRSAARSCAITVDDASPQLAADLANAVSARFIQVVGRARTPPRPRYAARGRRRRRGPGEAGGRGGQPPTVAEPRRRPRARHRRRCDGRRGALADDTSLRTSRSSPRPPAYRRSARCRSIRGSRPASRCAVPQGGYGEGVRRVRTNLLFADVDEPPALSRSPARHRRGQDDARARAGGRVRADLPGRRSRGRPASPVAAERLGLVGGVGLTDVLARRTTLEEAIQLGAGRRRTPGGRYPAEPERAAFIPADAGRPRPPARDVRRRPRRRPAAGPGGRRRDPRGPTDGALLLCRAAATGREQLTASIEAIRAVGGRLFGVILSMTPASKRDGYDDYRAAPAGQAAPSARSSHAVGTGQQPVVDVRPPRPSPSSPEAAHVAVTARPSPAPRAPGDDAPTQETRREAWRPPAAGGPRVNGHGPLDPSRG